VSRVGVGSLVHVGVGGTGAGTGAGAGSGVQQIEGEVLQQNVVLIGLYSCLFASGFLKFLL
jgi:hypothetical protein